MSVEELRYRKFEIWKRGIQLVKTVYDLLKGFPKHEQYALMDQLNGQSFLFRRILLKGRSVTRSKSSGTFFASLPALWLK